MPGTASDLEAEIKALLLQVHVHSTKKLSDTDMSPFEWYVQANRSCAVAERLFCLENTHDR